MDVWSKNSRVNSIENYTNSYVKDLLGVKQASQSQKIAKTKQQRHEDPPPPPPKTLQLRRIAALLLPSDAANEHTNKAARAILQCLRRCGAVEV